MIHIKNYRNVKKFFLSIAFIFAYFIFSFVSSYAATTLTIDSIGLSEPVKSLSSIKKLHSGLMYDILSKKVGNGKTNVVLVGHRYGNINGLKPNSLTNITSVSIGDIVKVEDDKGKSYEYKVYDNFVVDEYDDWITFTNNDKEGETLTIYTCSPMWDNKYRYVIKAKLITTAEDYKEVSKTYRDYAFKDNYKMAIFNDTTGIEPKVLYVHKGESFKVLEAKKKKYTSKVCSYAKAGEYTINGVGENVLKVVVE